MERFLGRKPKETNEIESSKKEKKSKKKKDSEKDQKKEKRKDKKSLYVPLTCIEFETWIVEKALADDATFLAWRPRIDQLALPAPVGEAWPTDVLRPISVDFGRSHFIFYGDLLREDAAANAREDIQRQQNLLYPGVVKEYALPKADRIKYLSDLVGSAAGEAWAAECELTSPSRNRVVARVKFELLARWLASSCTFLAADQARAAALYCLYFATQGPLAYLKRVAQERVPLPFREEFKEVVFACWSARVVIEKEDVFLRVLFRNYRPKEGVWQVNYAVQECPRQWELEWSISAIRRPEDAGTLFIRRGGTLVQAFSNDEKRKFYGVWWPATGGVVRYCDTCPTF